MPYILLLFGAILLIAGVQNTQGNLWTLVKGDFTGGDSFIVWIAAIAVVGGIGYIPKLKPLSIAFMTLLLIVLFLKNNGVVQQLQSFITGVSTPSTVVNNSNAGITPLPSLIPLTGNMPQGATQIAP